MTETLLLNRSTFEELPHDFETSSDHEPDPRTEPYRFSGPWVFDAPAIGLKQEPFVRRILEMIDGVLRDIPKNISFGFQLNTCRSTNGIGAQMTNGIENYKRQEQHFTPRKAVPMSPRELTNCVQAEEVQLTGRLRTPMPKPQVSP